MPDSPDPIPGFPELRRKDRVRGAVLLVLLVALALLAGVLLGPPSRPHPTNRPPSATSTR